MPTISIRVSDDLKSRLESLAQENENTMSAVITEALNSIAGIRRSAYSEETAPYTINNTSRLILRDQELLLSKCGGLDDEDRQSHARNVEILENGFTGEYPSVFAALLPEISYSQCEELFDILDMFRVLRSSYAQLDDRDRVEVNERDISFQGFDLNDGTESKLIGYVEYLFADDRYAELEDPLSRFSDGGNSHHQNLEVYRRMNRCFKQVWHSHIISFTPLNLNEIKQIVAARAYNSGY